MLFAAHRVALCKRHYLNVFIGLKRGYAVGLVLFNANYYLRTAQRLCNVSCAAYYFVGVLKHQPVVAGQVGFAFGAVQKQRVHFALGRVLYRRGESRAAHAHYARFGNACQNLSGIGVLKGCKPALFAAPVRRDDYKSLVRAGRRRHLNNVLHFARNARVYVAGDGSVRPGYQLPFFDLLSLFNAGYGRSAQRLLCRDAHFGRFGQNFCRQFAAERLAVSQMHAAE